MPTESAAFVTYHEVIRHLVDHLGADVSREADRDARRSIQDAYREVPNRHRWSYFYSQGRLATVASVDDGTIAYTESTRQVTLTGSTWPSWAEQGVLVISDVEYEVASRDSSTVITLKSGSTPGDDVASGTSYILYRDTYPLPCDCISIDEMFNRSAQLWTNFVHPRNWLAGRRTNSSPSSPYLYTIRGDPNYFGQLAASFYPPPDQAYKLDYIYQRRPRPLLIDDVNDGTITVTSNSTTVGGSGTAWSDRLVGSVIRFTDSTTDPPDGLSGNNPYRYERVVVTVNSATSLEIDATLGESLTDCKYRISDPIDVEPGVMHSVFLRCAEYKMALARNVKAADKTEARRIYEMELVLAKEADSRSLAPRAAGEWGQAMRRLSDMPSGADLG